jgi:hypothetical protein
LTADGGPCIAVPVQPFEIAFMISIH